MPPSQERRDALLAQMAANAAAPPNTDPEHLTRIARQRKAFDELRKLEDGSDDLNEPTESEIQDEEAAMLRYI